ncbi:hypothetical protein [Alkaliphilus sp. B6464]|uniref:hypothetical protein n=1 Tax=Alkaliphilus sp. B6464 TaxID=2731219 RepID=UPI002011665C|nr:hypothetical protein [Alkaliphilus sp. B6464]
MSNSGKSFGKFLLLWSGEFVSAIGSGFTSFGLGVYVFEQTGKASATALVMLLAFLPSLLLSAPAGVLADYVFTPLLLDGGTLAHSVGKLIGTGSGRGAGFLILIAGILLCVTSVILYHIKSVRRLENGGDLCIAE